MSCIRCGARVLPFAPPPTTPSPLSPPTPLLSLLSLMRESLYRYPPFPFPSHSHSGFAPSSSPPKTPPMGVFLLLAQWGGNETRATFCFGATHKTTHTHLFTQACSNCGCFRHCAALCPPHPFEKPQTGPLAHLPTPFFSSNSSPNLPRANEETHSHTHTKHTHSHTFPIIPLDA